MTGRRPVVKIDSVTGSLAIIGAGNMAEAIARPLLQGGTFSSDQVVAADVSPQRRELFQQELNIRCVPAPADAARAASLVLLCVKPQHMAQVLQEIAPVVAEETLVISIAAGVPTQFIESFLGARRVIRTMPNTPMLVGRGMVAMAPGTRATAADMSQARRLFEPSASVIEVTEDQLDAVTAMSGSGPAYFFYLIEQMIRAGVDLGLSKENASLLAIRTAIGAGHMLEATGETPAELRRRVTSPGGTTEAALRHMEQHRFDQIVIDAIKAAEQRGRELGALLSANPQGSVK